MEERRCPVCLSDEFNVFKEINLKNKRYFFAKCLSCKFVYVLNPNLDTVSHSPKTCNSIPIIRHRHVQIKKLLDRTFSFSKQVDVLEVGSGYGALGKLLTEDGRYRYLGYEPSTQRANMCQAQGLDVKPAFFEGTSFSSKVDVVILDNVLEHVLQPRKLISDTADALKPNGLLVVIVPNLYDMRQRIPKWRNRHHWQPHCHINYFTSYHLKYLFEEQGLDFRPFGFCTLTRQLAFPLWLTKIILDRLGFFRFGLYCFGVKT